ncbi:MAG: O-antigen ligase family protein [Candidatus Omnitrophica bacterium]|nr:O-antigen ligase family protein [Candidatus Omnitrophota bacterium]
MRERIASYFRKTDFRLNRQKAIMISEKMIECGFYGVIFFLPISNALLESFVGFVVFGFIINKALTRDFTSFKADAKIFWLLLALFIFSALSLINSGPFLAKGFKALFSKWAEYFLVFAIAIDHFRDRKSIKNFFYVFLFVGGLVGLSALSQKFLGFEFFRNKSMVMRAVTGPFENPNSLGSYFVYCLPIFILLASWKWKKKIVRILIYFVVVALGMSLLLTFSRSAWLGFSVGLLMIIILSKKKKFPLAVFGLFFSSLFLVPSFFKRVMYSFGSAGDSQRYVIWQGAVDMIKENPFFGKGLGTFMNYFDQYVPDIGIYYAHNCYLQMWAESGIFTLIAFLSLIGFILYRGVWISLKNKQDEYGILLIGLVAGVFGFLVVSFFDTQLYSLQLSILFWVMLGMTVAVQRVLLERRASLE